MDVRKYDKKQYWEMISVVFQDFSLPALTLGNVISGKDEYDMEKELNIFHKIGIDKWMTKLNVSFDQYLYNDFSDTGVEISGGESQKIAIARAVYKDAPFIILDEPTAALDPIAEEAILMISISYTMRRHVSLFHTDYIVVKFVILFWYLVKEERFKKEHIKIY